MNNGCVKLKLTYVVKFSVLLKKNTLRQYSVHRHSRNPYRVWMWTYITAWHICITKIPSSILIQWAHHLCIVCFQRVCRNKYESRHVQLCSDIFIKLTNIIGQQINYVNTSNSLAWTFPYINWFPVHLPALSLTGANIKCVW